MRVEVGILEVKLVRVVCASSSLALEKWLLHFVMLRDAQLLIGSSGGCHYDLPPA